MQTLNTKIAEGEPNALEDSNGRNSTIVLRSVYDASKPFKRQKTFLEEFFVQKYRIQKQYLEVSTTLLNCLKRKKRFLEQFLVKRCNTQKRYLEVSTTLLKHFKGKIRFLEQFLVRKYNTQQQYLEVSTTLLKRFKGKNDYYSSFWFKDIIVKIILRSVYDGSKGL